MDPFANLGSALRWLRWRRHRTQGEVAHSAGITRAMLSAYETGKQLPSLDSLGRLLVALGIDLVHLHEALALHQGRPLAEKGAEQRSKAESEPVPS